MSDPQKFLEGFEDRVLDLFGSAEAFRFVLEYSDTVARDQAEGISGDARYGEVVTSWEFLDELLSLAEKRVSNPGDDSQEGVA